MKNYIAVLLTAVLLFLTGCASKAPVVADAPEFLPTYLNAGYQTAEETKSKLVAAGFEIVAEEEVGKKGLTSIVFTHEKLKALANRPSRGFLAGNLRALVNEEKQEVKISNPYYFIKANLQTQYQVGDETEVMNALAKAFPVTTPSEDKWKYEGLADYRFMMGMPFYQDQVLLTEGTSVAQLVENATENAKKNLVFTLKLSDNRFLLGVRLSKRTEKFAEKIGADKAGILPWMILIEEADVDGKKVARAYAMDAKYHIAISYPLLDLGGFASIMSIPGAIDAELKKYFK
ncbi:MAG: hypothetical protein KU37_05640 [Sulfuricurvum sp. PC08-66]|nr:MAG: hypothetical protein KU37_05640 [Sulfuricurvum sp. PC08-66]